MTFREPNIGRGSCRQVARYDLFPRRALRTPQFAQGRTIAGKAVEESEPAPVSLQRALATAERFWADHRQAGTVTNVKPRAPVHLRASGVRGLQMARVASGVV
jgi:hypothetical protein